MKRLRNMKVWLAGGMVLLLLAGFGAWTKWRSHPAASARKAPVVELDPAKQKYIWDTEHITFELETHFGQPFMSALAGRDRDRLKGHFREGFEGRSLGQAPGEIRRAGIVSERLRRSSGEAASRLGADEFVASLMEPLVEFKQIERSRLRVLLIDQGAADKNLWKLKLLLTFDGTDGAGGPAVLESEHQVEVRFQDDSEIAAGRILTRWQVESESFRSSPRPLMEEVTETMGLAALSLLDNWKLPVRQVEQYRFQIAVADFDRDGFPDIAVATLEGQALLLRNQAGRKFENIAEAAGLRPWQNQAWRFTFLTGWIDYDNDGFPDLIMGDRLYRNVAGRQFEDVTARSQLTFHHHPMGCVVADYDCDGRLDLYVLYQHSNTAPATQTMPWVGDDHSGAENELWRNEGNGVFRNVTAAARAGGGRRHSFAAAWFFHDEDRFPDLYIANDFSENVLLRNRGDGTFEDVSPASGTTGFATSMGVAAGDLDNDGHAEIYVANMYSKMGRRIIAHVGAADYPAGLYEQIKASCAGNRLFRRAGPGRYEELSEPLGVNAVGWAYAPSMVDLDGDGWLDLYATCGFLSFKRGKADG